MQEQGPAALRASPDAVPHSLALGPADAPAALLHAAWPSLLGRRVAPARRWASQEHARLRPTPRKRTGMRPSQRACGAWWPRRPGSCWCQARCLFTVPDEFFRLFREGTHSAAWRKPVSIKVVPTFTNPPACARRPSECLFSRATELIRYGGSERTRTHQQDKRDEGLGSFQPGQRK